MSLREYIVEAWLNYPGKISTEEDRNVQQLLHFIEDWDDTYNRRLIDFINGEIGDFGVTFTQLPREFGFRLMESLPLMPRGSSLEVLSENKQGEKLLCPVAVFSLSKKDKRFFKKNVREDWDAWLEEFKAHSEAVLGTKLAWEIREKS